MANQKTKSYIKNNIKTDDNTSWNVSNSSGDNWTWNYPEQITTTGAGWTTITTTWTEPEKSDIFEEIKNSFGILYIEDDCIKIKTKSGEDVTIAQIDSDDHIKIIEKILVVFARESLVE